MTIDVVRALDLLETCAAEVAGEEVSAGRRPSFRRSTLTTRALAKLDIAPLAANGSVVTSGPRLTLGATIAFRAAHRTGRAGAPAPRALDAAYRAVHRYLNLLPRSMLDGADLTAWSSSRPARSGE